MDPRLAAPGVSRTPEFERILNLPRRAKLPADDATPVFRKPGGTMTLRPLQSAALIEAAGSSGGFMSLGVGEGKTLITLLLPEAMQARCAVLLVPAQLKAQLLKQDVPNYGIHFRLPKICNGYGPIVGDRELWIVAYSELSSATQGDVLERIKPDLIIADEAHNLRHKDAARTKRFLRYFKANPGTKFVALSGTMTTRSVRDYAHLIELALRKNSPVPVGYRELESWAEALDVSEEPAPPGALMLFCNEGENARQGFRRRLVESYGVVASEEASLGTSLIIRGRDPGMSKLAVYALATLRRTWCWDEEEYEDAMSLSRVARQLALGFYYKWDWPGGKSDDEWIRYRANWHAAVRHFLTYNNRPGLDSPLLVAAATARGDLPKLAEFWGAWAAVKDRKPPPVIPVWLDAFMIEDVARWAQEGPGIVWVEHTAVGEKIAADLGFPYFGPGSDAALLQATPENTPMGVIVCSMKAHGTGKNLQAWSRNLVTCPPANGAVWEQLLGRTHRPGQLADEVTVDVYLHTNEFKAAWVSALNDARYREDTTGQKDRLNYASKIFVDGPTV